MTGEPYYDGDYVTLGYLNTRLDGTNELIFEKSQNFGVIPTPPYRKYDTYTGADGIYICVHERLIGNYNAADWTKASTYVNVGDALHTGITTDGTLQASNGGTNVAGLTGVTSGDGATRIWAGATFANRNTAPFRVTQGGETTASNINITGGSLTWNNLNKPTKDDLGTWTTYMDDSGIYTGTLTANQINAVAINAGSIASGTLSTSRLNTDVITTSNLSAQSISASQITTGSMSAARITSGTMNAARISGGTISGTNATFGNQYSGGTLRYYNGIGYLSCGVVSDHPWVSALNIASTGGGLQGISFRTTSSIDDVGSPRGTISMNTANAMYITSNGTVNISGTAIGINGGNYCNIQSYRLEGHTFTGTGGAKHYSNANCMMIPADGYGAYINSTDAGNRIAVSSGGPSSRNVKKNIKRLKPDEYQNIYKDIQQLQTHTFQYKYENIKDKKDDFGFIIDEIEALPTISKYARNYNTKARVRNNKFIPRRENDEKQEKFKTIEYKEWDRDAYIKTMLLMIKSMQIKIDELEKQIKGGR